MNYISYLLAYIFVIPLSLLTLYALIGLGGASLFLVAYMVKPNKDETIFYFLLQEKKLSLIVKLGQSERKEFLPPKAYDFVAKERKR